MVFKKGLVSISFRQLSPAQIIELMKESGLTLVEWGSDVHAPCNDEKKLKEIARLQRENGIICSSYGTYFRLGVNSPRELPDYISAAKVLGTSVLRLWCGAKSSKEYTEDEKKLLFTDCVEAASIAEKEGVTLCLECHRGTFTDEKDSSLELMTAVDSKSFRMYWQPEVIHTVEENMEYARAISEYTVNIHVFNWDKNKKYPLSEATDTWKKYLECFDGGQALLLEFMPDDRPESLKTEAAALRIIGG